MRDIRSRISERQGIDLSSQQIQELAARRLEAILDPRTIKPSLMDELRRAAGMPADAAPSEPEAEDAFEESALYESGNGLLRSIRRLLNPILKLFFNPRAIVEAIQRPGAPAPRRQQRERQSNAAARRSGTHFISRSSAVWSPTSRASRSITSISRIVSSRLTARVDFNERRVRGLEHLQHQSRPAAAHLRHHGGSRPPPPPREESRRRSTSRRTPPWKAAGGADGGAEDVDRDSHATSAECQRPGLAGAAAVDQGDGGRRIRRRRGDARRSRPMTSSAPRLNCRRAGGRGIRAAAHRRSRNRFRSRLRN